MMGLSSWHIDKYRLDQAFTRVCLFAVLFPDSAWAGSSGGGGSDAPLVGAVVSSALLVFYGLPKMVSATAMILLALTGALGGLGYLLLTLPLYRAPPASLTPFVYLQMTWAIAIGWLLPAPLWLDTQILVLHLHFNYVHKPCISPTPSQRADHRRWRARHLHKRQPGPFIH